MKAYKLTIYYGLILLLLALSSCTVFKKHKTVQKQTVDSTTVSHSKIDSVSKVDSFAVRKSQIEVLTSLDTTKTSKTTVIEEKKKVVEYNDSGRVKKITYQSKKTSVKHEQQKAVYIDFLQGGNLDSSGTFSEVTLHKENQDSSRVYKQTNKVEVQKSRSFNPFTLWWLWLIILALAYLVYRYWPQIKAFVIHKITGL
jgi:hypothetical protein